MAQCLSVEDQLIYKYRGSMLDNGKFVSARDVGNIAAGWISGKTGLPWIAHRIATDALETKQKTGSYFGETITPNRTRFPAISFEFHKEASPTVSAQEYGYSFGLLQYK